MLAQSERRNDDAEYGQDEQCVFHGSSFNQVVSPLNGAGYKTF
jgi:hypothetical protein